MGGRPVVYCQVSNNIYTYVYRPINDWDVALAILTLPHYLTRIGAVTFFCTSPIPRCTVLSIDQDTGKKDDWASAGPLDVLRTYHSVLGTTQQRREGYFSISALPLQSGTVRVGDPVVVLETIKRAFGRVF